MKKNGSHFRESTRTFILAGFLTLLSIVSCHGIKSARMDFEKPAYRVNSVPSIIDDMKLRHEGVPHGVPEHWDWAKRPRIGLGNNPGKHRAMIATGKVYEDVQGSKAKNTRVQIRNLEAYYISKKNGKWHLLQKSRSVEGASFREDFAENHSKPADIRHESTGGISVKVRQGSNFHFWSRAGRVEIDANDIHGVFVTVQARLVVEDKDVPDDRMDARYLLSVGGDYWTSRTARRNNFETNADIGIGRFKYVQNHWRSFNMTTLTQNEIRQNPPPL